MYLNAHADVWHAINALVCLMIKAGGASEDGVMPANSQGFHGRGCC